MLKIFHKYRDQLWQVKQAEWKYPETLQYEQGKLDGIKFIIDTYFADDYAEFERMTYDDDSPFWISESETEEYELINVCSDLFFSLSDSMFFKGDGKTFTFTYREDALRYLTGYVMMTTDSDTVENWLREKLCTNYSYDTYIQVLNNLQERDYD